MTAMLDFTYYCRRGDIDKSFESLQAIKSPRVWSKVAPICINNRRIDLAELCLTHVASREGLAAFELAKKEQEVEVALAAAAIQFGLYETARKLYIECKRHDLENQLLQSLGQWDDAKKVSEVDDRVHLDLTRFNYATYLERNGELDNAVKILGEKLSKFRQLVKEGRLD